MTQSTNQLPADEKPWVAVAQDILSGRRIGQPSSPLRMALITGIRSINHPTCQAAMKVLTGKGVPQRLLK